MREQGRLMEWNDDRGFGFITPLRGGPKVFVHTSEFPRELRRPIATDLVVYEVGRDDRGRAQAHRVEFMTRAHARHEEQENPLGNFEMALPAAFLGLLALLAAFGRIPPWVFWFYVIASIFGFVAYWQDKRAALQGKWRTSEAALLGFALFGGWPGAYLARHLFRHKTRKQPFRTYFWVAVALNSCILTVLLFELALTGG